MPSAPSPSLPPRAGRERRLDRATVAAAAAGVADAAGLDGVTLTAVAQALEVRAPSLYAHVQGLAGLRAAVAALALRELTDAVTRAALGRSGREAVLALARAYRAYALARPGAYAASVAWLDRDDPAARGASEALLAVTLAVLAPGEPPDSHAGIHRVRLLRVGLHGFVSLETAGAFGLPADLEETFVRLVDRLAAAEP